MCVLFIWPAKRKYTTFSNNILLLIILLTYLTNYDTFLFYKTIFSLYQTF